MTIPSSSEDPSKKEHLHRIFEAYLEKQNLRQTRQRRIILEAVLGLPRHVDAETVAKEAKKIDPLIGLATVYRTLKMMVAASLLTELHIQDDRTRFEFVYEEHHDHLICTQCGDIIEFFDEEVERNQERIARQHGFLMTHHTMELFGSCEQCRLKSKKTKKEVLQGTPTRTLTNRDPNT